MKRSGLWQMNEPKAHSTVQGKIEQAQDRSDEYNASRGSKRQGTGRNGGKVAAIKAEGNAIEKQLGIRSRRRLDNRVRSAPGHAEQLGCRW